MKEVITKPEELTPQERERLELLQKADEAKGKQLTINQRGELESEDEIRNFVLGKIESPDKKHDAFYKGTQRLLIKHLPKGKSNQKLRSIILDEKNVFLARGKKKDSNGIRHADVRMGYLEDHEEALKVVIRWVLNSGTPTEIYKAFWLKNEEMGYGHQEEAAISSAFMEAMKSA